MGMGYPLDQWSGSTASVCGQGILFNYIQQISNLICWLTSSSESIEQVLSQLKQMELGVSHEQNLSSLTPIVDNIFDKYNKKFDTRKISFRS